MADLVTVWTLKLALPAAVLDVDLEDLEAKLGQLEGVEEAPFIWQRRSAVLTVWSQGNPILLTEVIDWAFMNVSGDLQEAVIKRMRTAPLRKREGYHGHDGS